MGEWGYVWAAYGVAWTTLVLYAVHLYRRGARARARLEDLQP